MKKSENEVTGVGFWMVRLYFLSNFLVSILR